MTHKNLQLSPADAQDSSHASQQAPSSGRRKPTLLSYIPLLLVLASGVIVYFVSQPISNLAKGSLLVVLLLALLLLNINVGVAMAVAGLVGIWAVGGPRALTNMLTEVPFGQTASFSLSVLPMFVFMGLLLWRTGVTSDLYHAAKCWLSWLPGGLAITTNMAGASLGAASGSTMGVTYAVGRIGIPEMLRAGYDPRLATGAVAAAGTIGQLIPPSILLVVYASFAEIPIGPQLMAGIVPALLLTLAYMLMILIIAKASPRMAPTPSKQERAGWNERWASLVRVWPVILLIGLIIGGMYGGWFTATEAGSVGAFGSLLYAAWKLKRREFMTSTGQALRDTLTSVGAIMFLMIGAALLNRMLSLTGVASWMAGSIGDANLNKLAFVLLLIALFIVLGMFMEPLALILIVVPILLPAVQEMGFSAMWFGVFVVLMAEIGLLTPPVGLLAFLVHKIAQDKDVNLGQSISLNQVFAGALWFVPIAILTVILLATFPQLVEWLPSVMH